MRCSFASVLDLCGAHLLLFWIFVLPVCFRSTSLRRSFASAMDSCRACSFASVLDRCGGRFLLIWILAVLIYYCSMLACYCFKSPRCWFDIVAYLCGARLLLIQGAQAVDRRPPPKLKHSWRREDPRVISHRSGKLWRERKLVLLELRLLGEVVGRLGRLASSLHLIVS